MLFEALPGAAFLRLGGSVAWDAWQEAGRGEKARLRGTCAPKSLQQWQHRGSGGSLCPEARSAGLRSGAGDQDVLRPLCCRSLCPAGASLAGTCSQWPQRQGPQEEGRAASLAGHPPTHVSLC